MPGAAVYVDGVVGDRALQGTRVAVKVAAAPLQSALFPASGFENRSEHREDAEKLLGH